MSLWSRWRHISDGGTFRMRSMWGTARDRITRLADLRRRTNGLALPGVRLVRPGLTSLPGPVAGRGSPPRARQVVRRLRIARTRPGPMQVVFEHAVVHEKFSLRARVVQRGARMFFKPLMHWVPLSDRSIRAIRTADRLSARSPRSRYVEPVRFELGGVPVESMTHRYGPDSDMTVLYFHGGGFFAGRIETHRRICERIALYTGATVISVDYVQLPDGNVADSVQDAITAYAALLDMVAVPDKIVVAGDSAGGYLTFKVAELATRRGLTPPAALLTFSPLLSLDPDRDDKAIVKVTEFRDAYLPRHRIATIRERWLPEHATIEGYASPLLATNYINSPAFFVAAEDEILRPEVEAMALQLAAREVDVEIHLWRGMVHAFPVLADAMPESRQALMLAADFARRAVGEEAATEPLVDPQAHEETVVGELVNDEEAEVDGEEAEIIDVELSGPGADSRKRWFFQAG
ncbi:MAG TPA: alpha/beta hydrolase fold domain-containing protein [Aeromicrobium sp.]|nr:alpha/beta hydrolase fold domain-containing protein [Aeromicrobium sp.]